MILLYINYVNKVDKRAGVYNESWIYHDNDLSYSIGKERGREGGREREKGEREGREREKGEREN